MKINIASIGGFRYSIPGSARNQKPRGDSILVGGLIVPHISKLKMTLMGGYRGMSGYWNEFGRSNLPQRMSEFQMDIANKLFYLKLTLPLRKTFLKSPTGCMYFTWSN